MKCFYHSADLDGFCSAAIVKLKYPEAELVGIDYGEPFPWDSLKPEETIYMVDYGIQPFDPAMYDLNRGYDFRWIDHHKSAIEDYKAFREKYGISIPGLRRDGIGACALVWEYLFTLEPMPRAVKYLAEYDVFNHTDPNTLPFQYGIRTEPDTSPTSILWDDLLQSGTLADEIVDEIIEAGKPVLDYVNRDSHIKTSALCFETELDGLKLIAANFGPSNSLFFDPVWDATKHDAMCLFTWRPRIKQWTVSLYTAKDSIDVSIIAKARGGGGHAQAAGFECDELPFELRGRV